jgi:DnaJ family protein C protein 3
MTFSFSLAIRDYQEALELDENFNRAKEGKQRAQKLQKQAERRDYYKILGVSRTANKRDIIKAYR